MTAKKAQSTTATCRFCEVEQPVDSEHFHRCKPDSKSGKDIDREVGFYVTGRCKSCATEARSGLDPNRVIRPRGDKSRAARAVADIRRRSSEMYAGSRGDI